MLAGLVAVLGIAAPRVATAQGVKVALLPAAQSVAPGSDFTLSLEVTRAGSPFNAFDAYIGYDPAALTLLPTVPISQQEGSYFVAGCASRFHQFRPGADRDTITDVLLCAATSLTGPGQIYKLRFHASNTAQVTTVRFLPGLQFYNGGLYVNPDSSSDALIGIGVSVTSAPVTVSSPRVSLVAAPNPVHGRVELRLVTDRRGGQRLDIADVQGRVVRRLGGGEFPAGARVVSWDACDDSGRAVQPGRYTATLRVPGRTITTGVTVVR